MGAWRAIWCWWGAAIPIFRIANFLTTRETETDGAIDKVLAELADAAVAKGLKEVDGDIVADDSYFPYDPYPAGWSAGDLFFKFGAPVSAIAFNDNTVTVEMRPGATPGEPPAITVQPEAAARTLGLELTTVSSEREVGLLRWCASRERISFCFAAPFRPAMRR